MSRLSNLLKSLPRPINTSAQPAGAISVSCSVGAVFTVKDGVLSSVPTSGTALSLTLRSYTMSSLVTAINAVTNYNSSAIAAAATNAYTILEGVYDGTGGATVTLSYFTSSTYRLLAPIAAVLDDADTAWRGAMNETDLRHADTIWLDRWGALYGIVRAASEPDGSFGKRIAQSVIQAKTNGYGLVLLLLNGLGVAGVTITDSATIPCVFTVNLTLNDSASFGYDTGVINSILARYKALGTQPILTLASQGVETYVTTNITDVLIDSQNPPNRGEWAGPEFAFSRFGG